MTTHSQKVDVVIIGGGQTALSLAYFLRRTSLNFVILDKGHSPGGAWVHAWDSLHLFSPAQWSSLPGWAMPSVKGYPRRDDMVNYLQQYEQRYGFEIHRPVTVQDVQWEQGEKEGQGEKGKFLVHTDQGTWQARAVISATGTWSQPIVPEYPNQDLYLGEQIHSAHYQKSASLVGKKVLIIGGGNSGAQILADVSKVAETTWVTLNEPSFLPDDVDGRVLFERATAKWQAQQEGRVLEEVPGGLGDIVMVESVREARERGVLRSVRPFREFTPNGVIWEDGSQSEHDAVIWCTGFKAALEHLQSLGIVNGDGKVALHGTRSAEIPNLWLVGYGEWTGFASATLIGGMRYARSTALEVAQVLGVD